MKALTIKQPWASLIVNNYKDIENRSWRTHFRGRIYIHASAKASGTLYEMLTQVQLDRVNTVWDSDWYPFRPNSVIIGEVDIIDCVINHPSIWAEKPFTQYQIEGDHEREEKPIYNWVLANPVLYKEPILNVKGKLSFWEFNQLTPTKQ